MVTKRRGHAQPSNHPIIHDRPRRFTRCYKNRQKSKWINVYQSESKLIKVGGLTDLVATKPKEFKILPNEPISVFGFHIANQTLLPTYGYSHPKNEPILKTRSWLRRSGAPVRQPVRPTLRLSTYYRSTFLTIPAPAWGNIQRRNSKFGFWSLEFLDLGTFGTSGLTSARKQQVISRRMRLSARKPSLHVRIGSFDKQCGNLVTPCATCACTRAARTE